MNSSPSPFWDRDRHADRRGFLMARGRIKKALRAWLEGEGFTEIEAGLLQVSPGNETHLHGFATTLDAPDGSASRLYLHTSPEFAAKKLLAAGETAIFDFARVFRNRERGPLHHPEFTMLEWYRVGASYEQMMQDCAAMARIATDNGLLTWKGRTCDTCQPFQRLALAEAFHTLADIDLNATMTDEGEVILPAMRAAALQVGIRIAEDDTWSDIFSRVLVEKIEPFLGFERLTMLTDYPAHEAALARRKPGDPRYAERFELYACGVELANAFGELTDPVEQRARFAADMAEKQRLYGESYPLDEDFLAALAHMPAASGAALGFDRLVMLATGAQRIEDVLWTPVPLQGTAHG